MYLIVVACITLIICIGAAEPYINAPWGLIWTIFFVILIVTYLIDKGVIKGLVI